MGLRVRNSVNLGKGVKLNVSKSGISASVKVGNTTYNTRRGASVRIAKGVSYHSGKSKKAFKKYRQTSSGIVIDTIDSLNDDVRPFEKETVKIQNDWDKMSDNQIKLYNIFMRTLFVILTILLLILTLFYPLCLILAVISIILSCKFDAKKLRSEYKNNKIK